MKKTDSQLQHDVMAELEWEPAVDHAEIGVAVTDGVVGARRDEGRRPSDRAILTPPSRSGGLRPLR